MLHKQPETRSTARVNWEAFGSGLLLSFLTANSVLSYLGDTPSSLAPPYYDISFPPWTAWLPFRIPLAFFLLLPPVLGIIIPFTVSMKRKNPISFALGRSLLVWAGVSVYWFLLAAYEDDEWTREAHDACQRVNYHGFCGLHLGVTGLFYYLFFSSLLLLLFTPITALIIKVFRKYILSSVG